MIDSQPAPTDVAIIGGGVIGLAIAWRAAQRGLAVTVLDPHPGRGASHVAAGMLAPVTELQYGEQPLLALNLAAARAYPDFAAELTEAAGRPAGYTPCGTLAVALDADDRSALRDLHAFQTTLGLSAEWLTGRDCRRLEPLLAPTVTGGLLVAGDHQVDNRALVAALLTATATAGVRLVRRPVTALETAADRVTGVRLDTGETLPAAATVLAAGCWSARLAGLPVRPVKGQIVRLHVPEDRRPLLTRTIRGTTRGSHVYLVSRPGGELVVGATTEELGFDTTVTAGGVYELLRDAHDLVPGVTELPLTETIAGLRPGTPDNAPILGPAPVDGLVYATGHGRNGILLTPVTADAIAAYLTDGALPEVAQPFTRDRFKEVQPV